MRLLMPLSQQPQVNNKKAMKTIEIKFQEENRMHVWQAPNGYDVVRAINQVIASNRKCENLVFHYVAVKEKNKTKFL